MVAIAERLGAKVQGDDGESYDGSEPLDDDDNTAAEQLPASAPASRRPWWRRLFGG
jgi:hypothetical protein